MLTCLAILNGDPMVLACLGIPAGVYLFYRGFRILQRRRLIMNTPTSKVRSASLGLVEVSGLAVGPHTITAPITRRECYYYRTTAWKLEQSGRNKNWKKVADEKLHVPFYLEDGTGYLLIDPHDAEMQLHLDFAEQYSNSLLSTSDVPATVRTFLALNGVSCDAPIKIEEHCIKPKNALFVLGTLAENPGARVSEQPVGQKLLSSTAVKPTGNPADAIARHKILAGMAAASNADKDESRRLAAFATAMGAHGIANDQPVQTPHASQTKAAIVVDESEHHRRELFATSFFGTPLKADGASPADTQVTEIPVVHSVLQRPDAAEQQRRALFAASVFGMPLAKGVAAAEAVAVTGVAVRRAVGNEPTKDGYPDLTSKVEEFDPRPPVVLMKGARKPEFFISWRSQREVVAELGWKAAVCIWGGPILTIAGVWVLLSRYGAL